MEPSIWTYLKLHKRLHTLRTHLYVRAEIDNKLNSDA